MDQTGIAEINISAREFPGVKALDDVSLTASSRHYPRLMGENGSGSVHPKLNASLAFTPRTAAPLLWMGKRLILKPPKLWKMGWPWCTRS